MAKQEVTANHRKIYAKGYFDGIEAAQRETGGTVNHRKAEAKLINMSGVTKRVYWAIPLQESWTPAQIYGELKRLNKPVQDLRHVTHCLKELADTGLVRESPKGVFTRDHIEATLKVESITPTLAQPTQSKTMAKTRGKNSTKPTHTRRRRRTAGAGSQRSHRKTRKRTRTTAPIKIHFERF